MGIKKLLALSVVGFASVLGASNPGVAYSASVSGINTLNTIISPFVFQYLQQVPIPDMEASGATLTNILFTLDQPAKNEDFVFSLNPSTNGVTFDAKEFVAHVTSDFKYDSVLFSVSGTAKVDITDITAQVGLDLATQPSTTGGLNTALKSRSVNLAISQDKITIDLKGDGVDDIAELIKPVIKSMISNQIVNQIKTTIPDIINNDVN